MGRQFRIQTLESGFLRVLYEGDVVRLLSMVILRRTLDWNDSIFCMFSVSHSLYVQIDFDWRVCSDWWVFIWVRAVVSIFNVTPSKFPSFQSYSGFPVNLWSQRTYLINKFPQILSLMTFLWFNPRLHTYKLIKSADVNYLRT